MCCEEVDVLKSKTYSTADEAHRKLGLITSQGRSHRRTSSDVDDALGTQVLRSDARTLRSSVGTETRDDGGRRRRRSIRRRGIEEDVLADVMAVAPVRRVANGNSFSC